MKKILVLVILLAMVTALCSCKDEGNTGYTDITPKPVLSDTAKSDATPTTKPDYEKKTIELKIDTEAELNGHKIKLSCEDGDISGVMKVDIDGKKMQLLDGDFIRAYLCGGKDGQIGIVLCTNIEEASTITLFLIEDDAINISSDMTGELLEMNDDVMRISAIVDTLGTWQGVREYIASDNMKITSAEDTRWKIIADSDRNLTALQDITVTDEKTGEETTLLSGSVVIPTYTDGNSYIIVKDVKSNALYRVLIESDGYGGSLLAGSIPEESAFSNIRYAG